MEPKGITESIREVRHELAAKFGNDIHRIAEDLRRQERESGRVFVRYASPPPGDKAETEVANESEKLAPNSK
jgi:hypothetical protein